MMPSAVNFWIVSPRTTQPSAMIVSPLTPVPEFLRALVGDRMMTGFSRQPDLLEPHPGCVAPLMITVSSRLGSGDVMLIGKRPEPPDAAKGMSKRITSVPGALFAPLMAARSEPAAWSVML